MIKITISCRWCYGLNAQVKAMILVVAVFGEGVFKEVIKGKMRF